MEINVCMQDMSCYFDCPLSLDIILTIDLIILIFALTSLLKFNVMENFPNQAYCLLDQHH